MKLIQPRKRGWLVPLLEEVIPAHAQSEPPVSMHGPARVYLRQRLRQSGLLFGTPANADSTEAAALPGEVLLHAVIRTLAEIALEIADLVQANTAPRREQLFHLLATPLGAPS